MTQVSADADVRRITLRLIPFLFFLYIVAYLDRVNVSFAQLYMRSDLGLNEEIIGLGTGIFFIGYFFFEVPSNLILQRVGARVWIARIMFTWGLIAMAMALAQGKQTFLALRFLLGLAEAGFFPGVILYLTYWYTPRERAGIISLFMTATALANAIGSPISGLLLGVHGFGIKGWQWLFILEGLPAVLLGFVVLVYLPNGPKDARWLSPDERERLANRLDAARAASPAQYHKFSDAIRSPAVWVLSTLYFCLVIGQYGIATWMPQMIKEITHQKDSIVGLLTGIPFFIAAVAMVKNGQHSDRNRERRLHVAIPAAMGAFCLILCYFAKSDFLMQQGISVKTGDYLMLFGLSLSAIAMWSTLGPFWALSTDSLRGTAAAGGIALINSVGNLGGFAGTLLLGSIKHRYHSFVPGLLAFGLLLLVGVALACSIAAKPASSLSEPG